MARYRMKHLTELTGMSRQAIHFYIKKGLVPPPIKHGKTSAEYTDEHVQRILEVRRLQEERFLPLDAIRASLDARDEGFTAAQRRVIAAVRSELASRKAPRGRQATLGLVAVARRAKVPAAEVEELIELGLVAAEVDARAQRRVRRDDLWLIELWGELRGLGFGPDVGFSPADLLIYWKHLEGLVVEEAAMVADRLAGLPPDEVSSRIERVLPVVASLVAQLHDRAIRRFLAQLTQES